MKMMQCFCNARKHICETVLVSLFKQNNNNNNKHILKYTCVYYVLPSIYCFIKKEDRDVTDM